MPVFRSLRQACRLLLTLAVIVLAFGKAYAQETLTRPAKTDTAELAPSPAADESKAAESKTETDETDQGDKNAASDRVYVRVVKQDGKPRAMQTAIARYVGKPGTQFAGKTVDLFGVVHIGQQEYYDEVDRRLATYDVVLYELVAPDGTRIRPEDLEDRRGLLASMQTGMKDMLNLEYQLEKIDYLAENFRHADMSPTEFSEDLAKRGDSVVKMVARMMGASLAAQSTRRGGDLGMIMAMMSSDRSMMLKRVMSQQLVDMESVTVGMQDANGDETLIKGRNRKAMEVLREELIGGKQNASVFYGAGHLPDMADRLENDFDMQWVETSWLDAWDLTRN